MVAYPHMDVIEIDWASRCHARHRVEPRLSNLTHALLGEPHAHGALHSHDEPNVISSVVSTIEGDSFLHLVGVDVAGLEAFLVGCAAVAHPLS